MPITSNKRLKIAILGRSFISKRGGAERYAVSLGLELAKRHEVHVFAQYFDESLWDHHIVFHKISCPFSKPRWINQLWFAIATQRAVDKSFDIVHSHENTWLGNVQTVHVLPVKYALLSGKTGMALFFRVMKIVTSPRLLCYWMLEKKRFSLAAKKIVVAPSENLVTELESAYPHLRGKVKIIPPGIDRIYVAPSEEDQKQIRTHLGVPIDGYCVLFVANDFKRKGLDTLLAALQILPDNYFVEVVGGCESHVVYEDIVRNCGLSERVYFIGAQEDMSAVYQSANCLAHPTLEDTFAMVVLEAMAHSLPVVVSGTAYCGIATRLTHEREALILDDAQNEVVLARYINQACRSPQRYEMIKNARDFAANNRWSEIVKDQEQAYYDIS